MNRRAYLTRAGIGFSVSLAGCVTAPTDSIPGDNRETSSRSDGEDADTLPDSYRFDVTIGAEPTDHLSVSAEPVETHPDGDRGKIETSVSNTSTEEIDLGAVTEAFPSTHRLTSSAGAGDMRLIRERLASERRSLSPGAHISARYSIPFSPYMLDDEYRTGHEFTYRYVDTVKQMNATIAITTASPE